MNTDITVFLYEGESHFEVAEKIAQSLAKQYDLGFMVEQRTGSDVDAVVTVAFGKK